MNPSPKSPAQVQAREATGVVQVLQGRVRGTEAQRRSFSPKAEHVGHPKVTCSLDVASWSKLLCFYASFCCSHVNFVQFLVYMFSLT